VAGDQREVIVCVWRGMGNSLEEEAILANSGWTMPCIDTNPSA